MSKQTFVVETLIRDDAGNIIGGTLERDPETGELVSLPDQFDTKQMIAYVVGRLGKAAAIPVTLLIIVWVWNAEITDLLQSYTEANKSLVDANKADTRKRNAEAAKLEGE